MNAHGYKSLSENEINDFLLFALQPNVVQVACARFDWKKFIRMSPDMVYIHVFIFNTQLTTNSERV